MASILLSRHPQNRGQFFFNYKGTFSLVLLAVVDHDYNFTMVDVGSYGRNSDSGIFLKSAFGKRLYRGTMNIPPAEPLTDMPELGDMPYCLVGDEAFPLTTFMLRPFPGRGLTDDQRIFNYRLSRARRISENAFGLLSARWRIFRRVINLHPDRVDAVVKATVILHNFIRKTNERENQESSVSMIENFDPSASGSPDTLTAALHPVQPLLRARPTADATQTRSAYMNYFTTKEPWVGSVILLTE